MSGWDQHNDNDHEPDIEYRWLTGLSIAFVLFIIAWLVWPWVT